VLKLLFSLIKSHRCFSDAAICEVSLCRLKLSVVQGNTEGTAVGTRWCLSFVKKSSSVKCYEQIFVCLFIANFDPGSLRIFMIQVLHLIVLALGNLEKNRMSLITRHTLIKSECSISGPKETINRVSNEIGGLLSSSYPGQLPRNERQIKHAKASVKEYNPADQLYSLMFQVKQGQFCL